MNMKMKKTARSRLTKSVKSRISIHSLDKLEIDMVYFYFG